MQILNRRKHHQGGGVNPTNANIVSWFPMKDTSDDASARALTNTGVSFLSGKVGNCGDFESTSFDYMSQADAAYDITGAITIGAWVYLESATTNNRGIVSKYRGSGGFADQRAYNLYVDSSNDFGFTISPDGTFASAISVIDSSSISLATWYHVVAVYEPSTSMKIYVNGVETASNTTSIPSAIHNSTADLWLGAQFTTGSEPSHWDGLLDEVFIADADFTAANAQWLYNSSSGRVYSDL